VPNYAQLPQELLFSLVRNQVISLGVVKQSPRGLEDPKDCVDKMQDDAYDSITDASVYLQRKGFN
jgi:hypothetical protein